MKKNKDIVSSKKNTVTEKKSSEAKAKTKLLNFFIEYSNIENVLSGSGDLDVSSASSLEDDSILEKVVMKRDINIDYHRPDESETARVLHDMEVQKRMKYKDNPEMVHICEQICNKLNKHSNIKAYCDSQSNELNVTQFLSNEIFEKKKQRNIFSKIVSFVKDTAEKIGLHPKRSLEHNLDVFIKTQQAQKIKYKTIEYCRQPTEVDKVDQDKGQDLNLNKAKKQVELLSISQQPQQQSPAQDNYYNLAAEKETLKKSVAHLLQNSRSK